MMNVEMKRSSSVSSLRDYSQGRAMADYECSDNDLSSSCSGLRRRSRRPTPVSVIVDPKRLGDLSFEEKKRRDLVNGISSRGSLSISVPGSHWLQHNGTNNMCSIQKPTFARSTTAPARSPTKPTPDNCLEGSLRLESIKVSRDSFRNEAAVVPKRTNANTDWSNQGTRKPLSKDSLVRSLGVLSMDVDKGGKTSSRAASGSQSKLPSPSIQKPTFARSTTAPARSLSPRPSVRPINSQIGTSSWNDDNSSLGMHDSDTSYQELGNSIRSMEETPSNRRRQINNIRRSLSSGSLVSPPEYWAKYSVPESGSSHSLLGLASTHSVADERPSFGSSSDSTANSSRKDKRRRRARQSPIRSNSPIAPGLRRSMNRNDSFNDSNGRSPSLRRAKTQGGSLRRTRSRSPISSSLQGQRSPLEAFSPKMGEPNFLTKSRIIRRVGSDPSLERNQAPLSPSLHGSKTCDDTPDRTPSRPRGIQRSKTFGGLKRSGGNSSIPASVQQSNSNHKALHSMMDLLTKPSLQRHRSASSVPGGLSTTSKAA